jgi:hypothetical protein
MADAERHLRKAVEEYAKYAAAWVTLGQVLAFEQRIDDARSACLQASTANPTYIPAYLCLADIAGRVHNWDEELKLSMSALEMDPNRSAASYEYHALANANLYHLDQAEKSALRAIDIDKDHREPGLHFLLANIYEMRGDFTQEAEQIQEYLKYTKSHDGIAMARQMLSKLENGSGKAIESSPNTDSRPVVAPATQRWAPPDVDEAVPPVLDQANCPLPAILRETSNHTQELIENLERFSANDRIQQIDIDKYGRKRNSSTQLVSYVAQIEQRSSPFPIIKEFRSGFSRKEPTVDSGTAGFALIFHPSHLGNLSFRCEGLGQLQGLAVWQLRFEESADPEKAFTGFRMNGAPYQVRLKGRAWIATGSYNVVRIETDLVAPIREIDLQLEHLVIRYGPVEFPANHLRLWLPESVSLYIAYRGLRYERDHSFSRFQLFSVNTTEAIKEPVGRKDQPEP